MSALRAAMGALRSLGRWIETRLWAVMLRFAARRSRRRRRGQRLYWGPDPIINYKYLSDAMREAGFDSTTLVSHDYPNFSGTRFDRYHEEVVEASSLPGFVKRRGREYVVFLHILRSYDIVHIPFTGSPLGRTPLAALEPALYRHAGIQTVIFPYGGDFFRYSWISEALVRHAFLIDYPDAGRNEDEVDRRVKRWMKEADIIVGGLMVEGASRWDILGTNPIVVPDSHIRARESWSDADGAGLPVTVVHAPNHRGVKGTEFILEAVERLRARGRKIDLVLLENRPNEEVLEAMREADICVDHCIGSGFGLFAIEAMASGATVVANLEDEQRLGLHRHFGWLNQCPIVSANIEQMEETLDYLIQDPARREELGRIGVEYVRRFHSPQMAQYFLGSIYRRLAGEDVDLVRLFHPITSEYMQRFQPLDTGLRRNRPPELSEARE